MLMNVEAKMILFLLFFLGLYGGINFYFFFRAKSIFHFSGILQGLLLCLLLLLIIAPMIVRALESLHFEHLAHLAAFIGYIWMAFVFFFFFLSISLELVRGIYQLIAPKTGQLALQTLTFSLSVFLAAGLVVYGYIDAQLIRVTNLQIFTDQMLPGNGKLRIVQISDVHVGILIRNSRLTPLLEQIRKARPDILVSTGDLLDGELDNIMKDAGHFAALPAKYGKFAVLGNHEYYAGLARSIAFTQAAGFQLLRDDVTRAAGITILGSDDIAGRGFAGTGKREGFKKALNEKRDDFALLLKHQPHIDQNANFNLMLSGHTHGGQLYPFGFLVKIYFPHLYGLQELAPNKFLYVSRGVGTWGPPVRVFAPPEITIIDLIGKKQ
jgi:uncharacterized protein